MYSHKPPLLKPHNKAKISFKNHFQKSALKPPSIKEVNNNKIHRLKRVVCKMRSRSIT